ncbi:hypothetical protein GT50_07590 [Geobacillus stearothermophilus 10]|nr:hypothetical protein GT50_07590 [Geobacillus stearothermophilus 10]
MKKTVKPHPYSIWKGLFISTFFSDRMLPFCAWRPFFITFLTFYENEHRRSLFLYLYALQASQLGERVFSMAFLPRHPLFLASD